MTLSAVSHIYYFQFLLDCLFHSHPPPNNPTFPSLLMEHLPHTPPPLSLLQMNSQILSVLQFRCPLSFLKLFLMLLALLRLQVALSNPYEMYRVCGREFSCGSITGIGYPFRGQEEPEYCGYPGLVLNCHDKITTIRIMKLTYRVLSLDPGRQVMKIAREDVMESACPQQLVNTTMDDALFEFASAYTSLTFLYGCPVSVSVSVPVPFLNPISSCQAPGYDGYYVIPGSKGPGKCNVSVVVPVQSVLQIGFGRSINLTGLDRLLQEGFEVKWTADDKACRDCTGSNRRCGYNLVYNQTACYCPDPPYTCPTANRDPSDSAPTSATPSPIYEVPNSTPTGSNSNKGSVALPIGLAAAGAAFAGIGIGWYVFRLRQKKRQQAEQSVQAESKKAATPPSSNGLATTPSINYSQSIPSYPSLSTKSDLEEGSAYFGAQVFSYAELEEATNNFDSSRELGDGGFGTVYYGKLHDGRAVAVKRLYENNFKRVQQFMTEVEILTRLCHKNLVTLHGCTSKRGRELLLVYEFIPNGTVADHMHGKLSNSGLLSWPIRLSIAIETADALAYLHASDVIHRDIKTNNILLDNDFRVKVADFGLSRLFPTDVTHVSTAPQGTPGYVDPEYYQCYRLTEKSDVYSFGVVLIELISSKPAVDTNRHRHDINLANMAINKIQNHTLHELVDPCLEFETNSHMRRMTTLVAELAFRCLQQERDMRPSMDEVLEALKGIQNEELNAQKVEVLDIMEDEVGLLKANPPFSPDSQKWV